MFAYQGVRAYRLQWGRDLSAAGAVTFDIYDGSWLNMLQWSRDQLGADKRVSVVEFTVDGHASMGARTEVRVGVDP